MSSSTSFLCKHPSVKQTAFAAGDHKSSQLGETEREREKCFRCSRGEVTVTSALQEATRSVTGVCACPRGSCVTVDVCRRSCPERSGGGVSEQALNAARPLATCTPPHLHAGVMTDAADCKSLTFPPPSSSGVSSRVPEIMAAGTHSPGGPNGIIRSQSFAGFSTLQERRSR